MRFSLAVIFAIIAVSAVSAGIVPPGMIGVSIESSEIEIVPGMGDICFSLDTIDIVLLTTGLEISGINLKIATPKTRKSLIIQDILPGDFIDSCQWEYFEVRPVKSDHIDSMQIWQITAVSELIPDSTRPTCYSAGDGATLAKLVVTSVFCTDFDTTQMISFFWESCADNSISDITGNKLFVSDQINNPQVGYAFDSTAFPTFSGTPPSCINDRNPNRPLRRIVFENGVLTPRLVVEEPPPADSTDN